MIEMKSTKAEFNNCLSIDFLSNFCYGGTEIIVSEMQVWGEVHGGKVTDLFSEL